MYKTGFGHGRHLHYPDVIQTRPKLYLQYVDTLAQVLGEKKGLSPNEISTIKKSIHKELKNVADIPRHRKQSLDFVDAYAGMVSPRIKKTAQELETASVAELKKKIKNLGLSIKYEPENLPNLSLIDEFRPHQDNKTVLDATMDYNLATNSNTMNVRETNVAIIKAARSYINAKESKQNKMRTVGESSNKPGIQYRVNQNQ